jgi:glycosyltransferase involved in cell wall biosynthesis
MRLVFVNRFYWPDEPATGQLLTDLAEDLAAHGHDVTVVASRADGAAAVETHRGVRIVRVNSTRAHRPSVARKAIDFATFYLGACWRVLWTVRRGDVVVSLTDPPLLGIGVWLASRLRGGRVVHWVQDIYPELAIELGRQRWLRILQPLRNAAWRHARSCVALGEDMASVLALARVPLRKISVIPNWTLGGVGDLAPAAGAALRREWKLERKFIVAYSGNLGRVHALEPVLDLAAAMRAEPDVAFVFIGGGAQRGALEAAVRQRGLPNVFFYPAQPRERLAAALALADVHLVTLRPGCENLVFPSKLYGVAAVGRPILFIGPAQSEVARLVREHDLGLAADGSAVPEMSGFLRHLMSDPSACARHASAARLFAAQHTRVLATARWESLLTAAGACDAPAARDMTRSG